MTRKIEPLPLPEPRGLRREHAAQYVGVSPAKFDELIREGRMPPPVKFGARVVWDRAMLDRAWDSLSGAGGDPKRQMLDRLRA